MKVISCDHQHVVEIGNIFNEAILNSTAIYDYEPRSRETIEAWVEAKTTGGYPIIGLVTDNGELMGFASFGAFRPWPAYQYSIEHSVYVDARFRGLGVGSKLLVQLISAATDQAYHMMVGGIDSENIASIALHQRHGFTHCASIREAGFKFGRWLDLHFYQLILPSRADIQPTQRVPVF